MSQEVDDPSLTHELPSGRSVVQAHLIPGVGDTLLMKFFAEGLTGRLFLEGQPLPSGVIFFVRGEPVHAEPTSAPEWLVRWLQARGEPVPAVLGKSLRASVSLLARAGLAPVKLIELLRDTSRTMVRELIGATSGTYRFKLEDPPDDIPLIAVNPFGQLLDSRRRSMRPDELFRVGEETGVRVPVPRAGFANVAARIRPFTGGVDLAHVIDGTVTAAAVYARIGLPAIVGGLILNTLAETGLIRWAAQPVPTPVRQTYHAEGSNGPLTMSEDAMPLTELRDLPEPAQALLSLYFDLKPERDPKVLFGPDALKNVGALETGYEARLAQIDARLVPDGKGRPYLLARLEELRGKLEQAYRQVAPERAGAGQGAFELYERIGVGGIAEVFRARSNADGSMVAVKRLRAETKDEVALVRELLGEAVIIRRIRHPNVVRVLSAGKTGDDFYLAMEYVDGGDLNTLSAATRAKGMDSVDVLCRLVADACGGLHAAHSARDDGGQVAPVLHRDVSPQNILVSSRGEAKLTDFGIARTKSAMEMHSRTGPGTVRGKLPYLAPELIREQSKATVRTDVYSMGMTLSSVLGHLPFRRASAIDTMRAILEVPMSGPSSGNPKVPAAVDAIVLRACALDPNHRYASALELQIALEQFLATRPQVDVLGWVEAAMVTEAIPEEAPTPSLATSSGVVEWSEVEMDL